MYTTHYDSFKESVQAAEANALSTNDNDNNNK